MSIFDLYSVAEIDSLMDKVLTFEHTANTNKIHQTQNDKSQNPEIDEDSIIKDILSVGMELLHQKNDSYDEISALKSRQQDSFKQSFEEILIQQTKNITKIHQSTRARAKKHQYHQTKSVSKSLEKCNKLLEKFLNEQRSLSKKITGGIKSGNKLHAQQKIRSQKRMKEVIAHRVQKQYKSKKQSEATTFTLKVPFKQALQRRGQELTLGHRLFNNANVIQEKKQKALRQKLQKQKLEESKITFKPLLHSKSYKMGSFFQRLASSNQKSLVRKASIADKQLKRTPFRPKLLSQKGQSKIKQIWECPQTIDNKSHNNFLKSFFSQNTKTHIKPLEQSSYIEIKDPDQINFLLE